MKYQVRKTDRFEKEFKKLDRYTQLMIKSWITKNLVSCEGPRAYGKALSANKKCLWRYRVGSYRIISEIQNEKLVGLALCVGHRLDIYEKYWSELLPLSEGLLVTWPCLPRYLRIPQQKTLVKQIF